MMWTRTGIATLVLSLVGCASCPDSSDTAFLEAFYLWHHDRNTPQSILLLQEYLERGENRCKHHVEEARELARKINRNTSQQARTQAENLRNLIESAGRRTPWWAWLGHKFLFPNWAPALALPPGRDADHEDVSIQTADGLWLRARWFECPDEIPAPLGKPRPTVLFLHGAGGDVHRWRAMGSRYQDALGAHVLVLDYRGYGDSQGSPSEAGTYLDSRAAYEYLRSQRHTDPERLIIVGQSLGGGIATELATSGAEHAALVLDSTFANVRRVGNEIVPFLRLGKLLAARYPSAERLRQTRYSKPVFISHGLADRLISADHARELAAAVEGPVALRLYEGMGHYDTRQSEYGDDLRRFLQQHVPKPLLETRTDKRAR